MAQLVMSNREICNLLYKFIGDNPRVSNISAEDSKIKIKIKTPGILPSVSLSIQFDTFSEGKARFHLEANPLVKLIIEFFNLPALDAIEIDASNIVVDINKILKTKIPYLNITNIRQIEPGQFIIDLEFA